MPRKLALAVLAGLATLALTGGCSKKNLVVAPSYAIPEGTFSSALELITFVDQPNFKIRMVDKATVGKFDTGLPPAPVDSIQRDPDDGHLLITGIQAYTPGAVRGLILNHTGAEGVEIFRAEANGSVRRIFDFALTPTRRWLDGGAEMYEFVDDDPGRTPGATYYARGVIGGATGANSPLSNPSRPSAATPVSINYVAERFGTPPGGDFHTALANFWVQWAPVAGASEYIVQVFTYQAVLQSVEERVVNGTPSPIQTKVAHDIFIGTVPANITGFQLGDFSVLRSLVTYRDTELHLGGEYYVRVSALGANHELIGMTRGPTITQTSDLRGIFVWRLDGAPKDYFLDLSAAEVTGASPAAYLLYSRGAVWVTPHTDPNEPTPAAARRAR